MDIVRDGMVVDAALQAAVSAKVRDVVARLGLGDTPDRAVHELGEVTLPDGSKKRVWLRHAADPVLLDEDGDVLLVTRRHEPGKGKLGFPGGFIDEEDGAPETPLACAIREAGEEAGIAAEVLREAQVRPIGSRRFDRPFDIREMWSDMAGTPIRKGDWMTGSTHGLLFRLRVKLRATAMQAGDDASAVKVAQAEGLEDADFAVADHPAMLRAALAMGVR